jgi:outer membrane protein assembly factor BamA
MLHVPLKKSWVNISTFLVLWLCAGNLFGQMRRVKEINIIGIEKTKEKVLLRQLTFSAGDTIDLANLKEVLSTNTSNIYNLGLFNVVEIDDSLDADSAVVFSVSVRERWYVWPNPYIAFEERTFTEWWADKDLDRLVYGGGVTIENLSGWNDRLLVYGQLGYSRRASLSYNRPFLFPQAKIDGLFGMRYINNKEIGYTTLDGILQLARLENSSMRQSMDVYAQLGKRITARRLVYLTANFQYFRPNDSIIYFNEEYLTTGGKSEYYPSLTLSYINDQRDIRSFPLKGYKYAATLRSSGFPGLGTTQFGKATVSVSHHIPLGKRFNFAWGAQGLMLIGNRVPYFDKFFIGFDNFIRGYEPYVIDGSMIGLGKTELKFAIIPRKIIHVKQIPFRKFQDFPIGLYLSAFGDAGYVHDATFNNHDNYLKDKWLAGCGLGINFITMYDKLVRFEFSINRFGGYGFNLNTIIPFR